VLGLEAVDVAIQPHHRHAVCPQDVLARPAATSFVALEGQPVRLVLVQYVLDILDGDCRVGLGVGANRQFAPGEEDVAVLILGERKFTVAWPSPGW